jgi:phage terminase small subunit
MPGRPPKPTKVLKTQGTARKDRHAERNDLELGGELPQPPKFLNETAKEEWLRVCTIGKYAKALSQADRGPLTMYCILWAELVVSQTTGQEMQTSRMALYANLAGKFGMNPSERAKIHMPEDEKPKNKFAAALSEDELSGPGVSLQ